MKDKRGDKMAKQGLNLTAIIVVAMVVLAGIGVFYIYQQQKSESTVTANGNSQMSVMPDEVSVYLMIETRNLSAETAKNDNAVISEKVMAALKGLGIADKDIETQNFNINPEIDWTSGTQKITGYIVQNSLIVKTKDFSLVGKIVDSSVDAGSLVNSINFELSNEKSNQYKTLAIANATQDARIKAEAIAAGLGKTVGRLISVSASDYNYYPYPIYARAEAGGMADAKVAATQIQPKNIDVSASASVVYQIK